MTRIETGPVQFNEDWPGIFIRGDDAFRFLLDFSHGDELTQTLAKERLRVLLLSCMVGGNEYVEENVQKVITNDASHS